MTGDLYAAAEGPKRPSGLALRRANTRILAKRLGWPAGALRSCWDMERRHPGWLVTWLGENTTPGFERPAGFWAVRDAIHRAEVFDPAPSRVEELIGAAPPAEHDFASEGYCPYCGQARPWRAGF